MAHYNFDQIIDRRGTACIKYDGGEEIIGRDDLLPMWVADMDFALPQEVLDQIKKRVDHGIFGYTMADDHYYDAVVSWFARRYGWEIEREWITAVPGVVYGLTCALRAVTDPGDAVMIQEPVYYPFRSSIEKNGRVCVNNQLKYVQSGASYTGSALDEKPVFAGPHYEIDFDDFEKQITDRDVKAFVLCSPHNPVGRVWTRAELEKIAQICSRHHVTVISDEIHCDFIYPMKDRRFVSYGQLDSGAGKAIICTAPSKTFNTAGLQASNIIIRDAQIRERFRQENSRNGYSSIGTLAQSAVEAVYERGEEWLDELIAYLQDNITYMQTFLRTNIPQVRMIRPEGTYLVWIDFSRVADTPDQMKEMIQDDARLWLDNGALFSEKCWMFERFNIACPRAVLEEAMHRLEVAVKHRLDDCYATEWIMEWYRADE